VVAYALMGTVTQDMNKTPLGDKQASTSSWDIWPSNDEVRR
jgi:aconitase A